MATPRSRQGPAPRPDPAQIQEWLEQAQAALEADDAGLAQARAAKIRDGITALGAADESAGDLRASLGHLLFRAGDYEAAVTELGLAIEQQALRLGDADHGVAQSHRLRGMALLGLQRADDALVDFETAARARADSAEARLLVGHAAALLGHLHVAAGRADQALPALRRALELLPPGVKEIEFLRHPAEDDLGYAFLQLDRLDAAEHLLEVASERAKAEHGAVSLEYADRLWRLAQLYARQHRLPYAAECARRCVAIRTQLLPPDDPRLGQAYLVLGGILTDGQEWSAAHDSCGRAAQIMHRAVRSSPWEYFLAHTGTLHAAVKSGEVDESERALEALLELAASLRPGDDPGPLQPLVDLAAIKEQKGQRDASRALVQRAHEAGRRSRSELGRNALLDLARLHVTQGSAAEAVTVLGWVADLDSALAERLVETYHFPQRIVYSETLADATTELVRVVLEHLPGNEDAARVALRVVLARKALFTEADIAHNHRARALEGRGVDEQLAHVESLRAELRALLGEGPVDGHRKLWAALDAKKREIREAESQLAGALDDLPAIHRAPAIDLDALATRLAADEALVEFLALRAPRTEKSLVLLESDLLGETKVERYVAFVLRGGAGSVRLLDLGEAESIERLIYSYIAAVHPSGEGEVSRERRAALEAGDEEVLGARLRERVFDPIAPLLPGVSRLRIAPDGAIAAVSFALLPLAAGGRLVDQFEPSYLSCGRVLLRPAAGPGDGPASEPVIVSDPDFDVTDLSAVLPKDKSSPDFYFTRLPRSAEEGERVLARIGGVPLRRERASLSSLLGLRSPALLHLATHGYFLPPFTRGLNVIGNWRAEGFGLAMRSDVLAAAEEPLLRSGLALSGVNAWSAGKAVDPSMGDGLLTALEVTHLDLRLTEVVVLSSCSAARGSVRPGEGSAGLLQAFEAAGARRVVAALWAMADHPATVTLIDTFYAEMLAGNGAAAALRRAQLYLKRLGAPPWVWGALVAYGDRSVLRWRPSGGEAPRGTTPTTPAGEGARS